MCVCTSAQKGEHEVSEVQAEFRSVERKPPFKISRQTVEEWYREDHEQLSFEACVNAIEETGEGKQRTATKLVNVGVVYASEEANFGWLHRVRLRQEKLKEEEEVSRTQRRQELDDQCVCVPPA